MDQLHGFYGITLESLPVAKVGVDNSKLLFNSKLTYVILLTKWWWLMTYISTSIYIVLYFLKKSYSKTCIVFIYQCKEL